MSSPTTSPTPCPQCAERTGLGVVERTRTTWWRRLTRKPPTVIVHIHINDRADLDGELKKLVHQSTQYRPFPR